MECEIQTLKLQLNSFCSLIQETYGKIGDIEILKSQVKLEAEKTYNIREDIKETKKDSGMAREEESILIKYIN